MLVLLLLFIIWYESMWFSNILKNTLNPEADEHIQYGDLTHRTQKGIDLLDLLLPFTNGALNREKSEYLLKWLGISLLFVWPGLPFKLILSGGPKWPENSCVCLDPQLLLCPDIFISEAYLWQQCMCKGPSGLKWQTDYMTSSSDP